MGAYRNFAEKLRTRGDLKQVNERLTRFSIAWAVRLDRAGNDYREAAASIAANAPDEQGLTDAQAAVKKYADLPEKFRAGYERLRSELNSGSDVSFPSVWAMDKPTAPPAAPPPPPPLGPDSRVWTTGDGKHRVAAKYLGTSADGQKVILQRNDGKRIEVPIDQLSEADRKYIEAASQK
jgi:hypothetical protein